MLINRKCKYCSNDAKKNIINGRNKGYCRTCGNEECLKQQYKNADISLSKGRKGNLHSKWISNRNHLKSKRMIYEEKEFFKKIIENRKYKCEITNINGILSVHHINGVWSHPELKYDEKNCIVILNKIHKHFHSVYGYKTTKENWDLYIKNEEYKKIDLAKKNNFIPKIDLTGKKFEKLLIIEKSTNGWKCLCDCGNVKIIKTSSLKNIKSCGCYKKEYSSKMCKEKQLWKLSHKNNKKIINGL